MKSEMFNICCDLMMDEFEIIYWVNILDSPDFDILTVRQYGLSSVKIEHILFYTALQVKVYCNPWVQIENLDDPLITNSELI